MAWRHENDCMLINPNTQKPVEGARIFTDNGYPVAEVYYASPSDQAKIIAAPVMLTALETVLAYMTNVNAYDPQDVVKTVMEAMRSAGYDPEALDDAAMAMLRGAAHK